MTLNKTIHYLVFLVAINLYPAPSSYEYSWYFVLKNLNVYKEYQESKNYIQNHNDQNTGSIRDIQQNQSDEYQKSSDFSQKHDQTYEEYLLNRIKVLENKISQILAFDPDQDYYTESLPGIVRIIHNDINPKNLTEISMYKNCVISVKDTDKIKSGDTVTWKGYLIGEISDIIDKHSAKVNLISSSKSTFSVINTSNGTRYIAKGKDSKILIDIAHGDTKNIENGDLFILDHPKSIMIGTAILKNNETLIMMPYSMDNVRYVRLIKN